MITKHAAFRFRFPPSLTKRSVVWTAKMSRLTRLLMAVEVVRFFAMNRIAYRKRSLKVLALIRIRRQVPRRPSRKSLWLSIALAMRRAGKDLACHHLATGKLRAIFKPCVHAFSFASLRAQSGVTPNGVSDFVKSEKYEEEYPFERQ
ncbi:hypothetical protein BHE74_00021295 [Ensete ventricosum]|nr:hypothetical protein GW17_00021179 [Ensete ventricosum]RWW71002.1 hypothetical protein BHE74_00021295 [Ensete ventricosum]